MTNRSFIVAIAVLLVLQSTVWAGHISLNTRYTFPSVVTTGNFTVNVEVKNTGDEAAYDVSLTPLLSEDLESEPLAVGNKIAAGGTFTGEMEVNLQDNVIPGEYALAVLTDYKDANGYPFSSVSIPPEKLVIRKNSNALVSATIERIKLPVNGKKNIKLNLRNLEDKEHQVRVLLLLPREFDTGSEIEIINLESRGERRLEFDLMPKGALSGSTYVIYALLEYDEDGIHHTSNAVGVVEVVEEEPGIDVPGYAFIALVFIAIALFIGYQFIAGKKEGGEETE
ncbi:MAG: CARDB domain-containing protein, partial [Candidatus Altiarchaeota archaeon]|nr:CARDB domain-containing protein [Candidatus Altiarchaeota archaeon]